MSKNNVNCCVYGCHTKKGRERQLSFHNFPKEKTGYVNITNNRGLQERIDRKKAWEKVLLMPKAVTSRKSVCSLHFKKDDFILPDFPSRFARLKKTAVPSQNLPQRSIKTKPPTNCVDRLNRRERRASRTTKSENKENINDENFENSEETPNITPTKRKFSDLLETEKVAVGGLLKLLSDTSKEKQEKSTQVTSGDILVPFINSLDTDKKLNSLTGLESFEMLGFLVELVTEHFPEARRCKLSIKERIILTFIKMKTGLRYVVLAALFGVITNKTCKIIFHSTISKLAIVLKPFIFWPSQEDCRRNLPICFQNFSNVRVVLDCTELSVQQSKCLCCRIKTYSHYKGYQTIKFMTGVTPAGLISFVSKAYGGRASDKAIFQQSAIIEKLVKGEDAVMVDKGFLIDDLTDANFIKLIRPPFLKKKPRFSEEESKRNIEIAKARVHVERANQRIKVFEIFGKPLCWTLVPKIEEMFIVACAIVNLSAPILSESKFLK